jgi:PKHD-type hydroxylase
MFLVISDVLSADEIAAARGFLAEGSLFSDGASTAGRHARAVKNNEQADAARTSPILKKTETVLMANPVFKAAARPQSFVKLMVSRYRKGMAYGTHVDNPLMEGKRTDLSLTLFLSEPETYSGGELVIEGNDGDRLFKLPAGSLVLYPTTTLHRVNEVTSGERLAIVGWVRSLIRNDQQRELLFDLDNAVASLGDADRAVADRLHKVRANLVRMWSED